MANYLDTLADLLRKGSDTLVNLPTEAQRFITNPQAFTETVTGKNLLPKETGFVAGATGLPLKNPAQGGVLNPASAPYQEGYEQGEPVAIASMAVPAYAGALRAGAPKVYNALENYMVKSGGMIPLEAYHGTPHKIEGAFDIKKMGTGEGAQAYGPGMYFAEAKPVAQQYANELGSRIDVNGKPLYNANKTIGSTGNTELDDYLVANLGDVKATRKQLLNDIKEIRPTNPVAAKEMQTTLADLRKANVGVQNTGNLYKVDIPDEYIPNMLDWDKPFANQSKEVKEILKSSGLYKQYKQNLSDFSTPMQTRNKNARGENIQAFVEHIAGSPEKAAKMLDELGIKGIRYLDEGSRAKGRGTSNFVVFEPSTVKILEENGKPVSRKAILEEQVKNLKE